MDGYLSEADRRRRADRDRREASDGAAAFAARGSRPQQCADASSMSARRSPIREAIAGSSRTWSRSFARTIRRSPPDRSRASTPETPKRSGWRRTRLKGAIATVGASAGRQAAAEIEQRRARRLRGGRSARLSGCAMQLERLDEAFAAAASIARPARRREPPPQTPRSSTKAEAIMSRILVVDDDKTTRHVLRSVLTSAGFSTAVAKDGVEALKVAEDAALRPAAARRLDAADERAGSARETADGQITAARRRDDVRRRA